MLCVASLNPALTLVGLPTIDNRKSAGRASYSFMHDPSANSFHVDPTSWMASSPVDDACLGPRIQLVVGYGITLPVGSGITF